MNADISSVISTLQIRLLLQANCKPDMKNCCSFLLHFLLNHVCVLYYLWFSFHSRVTSFIYLALTQKEVNPYSHQHQFSPNNLTISIHCQEKWIWELIKWSAKRSKYYFDLLLNSLIFFFLETYEDESGEFVCGYWALARGGGGGGVLWISSDRDDWRIFRGRKILASIFLHSLI